MKKIGRNHPCHCGSNKKYKKCCLSRNHTIPKTLFQKIKDGDLPFCARVISHDGQASSMKISNVKVVQNGVEKIILNDEITLSTNSIKGDTFPSSATLTVPIKKEQKPEIKIIGNASVVNVSEHYQIEPLPKKGLKILGANHIFAKIRTLKQGDQNFDYFDILFGEKENKNHAHIGFCPDGNGHFIEFRTYNCKLESLLSYSPIQKSIAPSKIQIEVTDFLEGLIMEFEFDSEEKIVRFKNASFAKLQTDEN